MTSLEKLNNVNQTVWSHINKNSSTESQNSPVGQLLYLHFITSFSSGICSGASSRCYTHVCASMNPLRITPVSPALWTLQKCSRPADGTCRPAGRPRWPELVWRPGPSAEAGEPLLTRGIWSKLIPNLPLRDFTAACDQESGLTSWFRKTRKRSAGEVRNFSLMLNLQVGRRTPVLTGADVLLDDEIWSTKQINGETGTGPVARLVPGGTK